MPQRDLDKYIQYQNLLSIQSSSMDPTVPYYNDFHLLGLDESSPDGEIAQQALAEANTRGVKVDLIGQAQEPSLSILLRNTINQAGMRFNGNAQAVRDHRAELNKRRTTRLKEVAKSLCDQGKWTEKEAKEILDPIAMSMGVQQASLDEAVEAAVLTGLWAPPGTVSSPPPPSPSPSPPPGARPASNFLFERLSVGKLDIPLWIVLPVVGIVLGVVNGWTGVAYGLLFLICAGGLVIWERRAGGARPERNLVWGSVSLGAACLPLMVLWLRAGVAGWRDGASVKAPIVRHVGLIPGTAPLWSETFLIPAMVRTSQDKRGGQAPEPGRVADGDISTVLVPSAGGDSPWVELDFGSPTKIEGLAIFSFPKDTECAPVRQALLSFHAGGREEITLDKIDWWQVVPIKKHEAKKVRLTVQALHSGAGETRPCINEVWLIAGAGSEPDVAWAGQWKMENWGDMTLGLQGSWVTGSYDAGRKGGNGRLTLLATGRNQLDGFWCRGPSCAPPNNAGRIRLVLADDKTISGQYREGFEQSLDAFKDEFEKEAYRITGARKPQK